MVVWQVENFLFSVEVGWKYPQKLTCLYLLTSSIYTTYKNWHMCKWVYLFTQVPILIYSVLKLQSHMILRILMVCSLTLTFLIFVFSSATSFVQRIMNNDANSPQRRWFKPSTIVKGNGLDLVLMWLVGVKS